mmetsp:Transcript_8126/g.28822  ORF Transcript_8126/g.28822 Transcript_8126/m.28822 type:complete len:266 (-) Transcript_8126:577-1374(-)
MTSPMVQHASAFSQRGRWVGRQPKLQDPSCQCFNGFPLYNVRLLSMQFLPPKEQHVETDDGHSTPQTVFHTASPASICVSIEGMAPKPPWFKPPVSSVQQRLHPTHVGEARRQGSLWTLARMGVGQGPDQAQTRDFVEGTHPQPLRSLRFPASTCCTPVYRLCPPCAMHGKGGRIAVLPSAGYLPLAVSTSSPPSWPALLSQSTAHLPAPCHKERRGWERKESPRARWSPLGSPLGSVQHGPMRAVSSRTRPLRSTIPVLSTYVP